MQGQQLTVYFCQRMIFKETKLKGAYIVEPERIEDRRGFFARTWCEQECKKQGINTKVVQCNVSFNKNKGTLRGMHYQAAPYGEVKLIRCTAGSIYDVIIDLRPDSETFKQWVSIELNSESLNMLYIPENFAHGFLTLEDCTEVFYQMSEFYYPDYTKGIRWNDPSFSIQWPIEVEIISDRDRNYPCFDIHYRV